MIFYNILGIKVFSDRIEIAPWLPDDINMLHISNLHIRSLTLDIKVEIYNEFANGQGDAL